jgi:hypothetical protein
MKKLLFLLNEKKEKRQLKMHLMYEKNRNPQKAGYG